MESIALQLDRLRSPNKNKRYDACEELRLAPRISPEAVSALEQASQDADPDVADAARRALLVHAQDGADVKAEIQISEAAPVQAESTLTDYALMLKEIRSWGFWSLGWGALHIIVSGFFSAPWGILLLVVGLASFYFRTASMFILYAVTLAWAAVSNMLGGVSGWAIFGLLQIYFAVRVFGQYRRFHKAEEEFLRTASDDTEKTSFSAERTRRLFPWIGVFLGGWSLLGWFAVWVAIIVSIGLSQGTTPNLNFLGILEGLDVDFGVLGFAVGLASLLSGYRPKVLTFIGLITGALTMTFELVVYFLLR